MKKNDCFRWEQEVPIVKRLFRIMKLTTFLLLISVLGVMANKSYSQTLSLNVENTTLKEVLSKIEDISGCNFLYSEKFIDVKRKVSISVENKRLDELLDLLFSNTNVDFERKDRIIILSSNTELTSQQQILTVTGHITDSSGASLPGVTVVIKGTTKGTITDTEGKYLLNDVPSDAVLDFSFVGMSTQEIPVGGKTNIDVVMTEESVGIEEVVAIGYGVQKKSDLTGSVASLNTHDIANNPTNNPLETLQGRVSGIDITRNGGGAGSGISITMRGERSLNASNSPLVLVDGIAYGGFVDINPSDIESIEVLKDASSTAIYGSRGANGVILVTTKKGKQGKSTISVNAYYSFNQLTDMPKFMDAEQYANLKREVARASGIWNSPDDDANALGTQQLDYLSKGYSVDWFDLVLNNGYTQNYEVAMRGGNAKTNYSLSVGVQDEQGLLKTGDHFTRYNSRLSVDHKVRDNLTIGADIMYTYKDQDNRNASFWNIAKFEPIAKPYNDDGSLNLYPIADRSDVLSPLADDVPGAIRNNTASNRFFGVGNITWEIVDDLVLNSTFGINHTNSTNGYFNAKETTGTLSAYSESGANLDLSRDLTWENTLNYTFSFAQKHELNAMLGTSTIADYSESYTLYGRNQALDLMQNFDLGSNTDGIKITSTRSERQLASFFGRFNYKFEERFLLTATLRADGSSVLAKGNKWGYFPSFAGGWRINQESWMADAAVISNLKLRLSWGQSGQSGVDPYSTMASLGNSTYAWTVGGKEVGVYGYYPKTISNPDLKWETTAVLDAGLDFGLWNNRLSGSVDFYKSVTSDILMDRLLPNSSGFSSIMQNIGETKGSGVDATIGSLNIKNTDFQWNTDINFSYNKNEITKLSDGITQDVGNSWFVGEPISVFYDYKKIGIWQLDEADEAATFDQVPGEIKVQDVSKDDAISDNDRVVYNRSPKFTFGVTNRFSYKNVDLSFFVYGRFGNIIDYNYYGAWRPGAQENDPNVDYWTPENPTNDFPRPITGAINYKSTLNYVKGDFLKIKDITLAYNLPKHTLNRWGLSRLRFYLTLKNHFVFSSLDNYDPERGGTINYPLTKQTVLGVNFEF